MSEKVKIHIGSADEMEQRFIEAWKRAERRRSRRRNSYYLRDLGTLLSALTPKRLELLRYVRHNEVRNVKALAVNYRRDYKNVHQDVEELIKIGLLARTAGRVLAPFGEVQASLLL